MTGTHAPFGHDARVGRAQRFDDRASDPGTGARGVERAIVGLPHDRVDRANRYILGLGEHPLRQRVARRPDTQGTGEQDGGFDLPQFTHLRDPQQLAETIPHMERSRHAVPK